MTAPLGYGSRRLVTENDFQRVPILTPKPYNWVLPWIFLFCRSLWLPWIFSPELRIAAVVDEEGVFRCLFRLTSFKINGLG